MEFRTALDTAKFLHTTRHDIGQYPNYEDVLERAYRLFLQAGMNIVDIGAHGGRHTRVFHSIVTETGKIWAFEPLPHMAGYLRTEFANTRSVHIEQYALANRREMSIYKFVSNAPEESGLRERIYNISDPIIEDITVEVTTADHYFAGIAGIDYVKIDVEGGEINCLAGMSNFLKLNRPFISVEYGFPSYSKYGNTNMSLWNSAVEHDMVISDLFGNIIPNSTEWVEVCDHAYWDYFLVPAERQTEWKNIFENSRFPEDFIT